MGQITPYSFTESSCENVQESSSVSRYCSMPTDYNYRCLSKTFRTYLDMLQVLGKLLRVTYYLHFRTHKKPWVYRISISVYRTQPMLSPFVHYWILCLLSSLVKASNVLLDFFNFTTRRSEQYSSCNTSSVDYANDAIDFILYHQVYAKIISNYFNYQD
jgi:hypothetical protein